MANCYRAFGLQSKKLKQQPNPAPHGALERKVKRWIPKVGEMVSLEGTQDVRPVGRSKVVRVSKHDCRPGTVYLMLDLGEELLSTTAGKDEIVILGEAQRG